MIGKLLQKELKLCLHPTSFLLPLLVALILTPNYPYPVSYFYLCLAVFFICLTGRENHDITYSLTLPVAKADLVTARFLLVMLIEWAQLALAGLFIWLHGILLPQPNAAGMDANLALIGEGFFCFGLFHLVFFPSYYKNVDKVGISFLKGAAALFVLILVEIVLCYALPLYRNTLDTPDPMNLGAKLLFCAVGLLFYLSSTWVAWRLSQKRFQQLDIR